MTGVQVVAVGPSVATVIANMRERLDEQLGEGRWALLDFGEDRMNPAVELELSAGGQTIASVKVTMWAQGDWLSTSALPREVEA